jgi:hypothetical protein
MLRNIFATDQLKEIQPLLDEVKKRAKEMGSSASTLLGNYIKRD